jgi:hypothetical protein
MRVTRFFHAGWLDAIVILSDLFRTIKRCMLGIRKLRHSPMDWKHPLGAFSHTCAYFSTVDNNKFMHPIQLPPRCRLQGLGCAPTTLHLTDLKTYYVPGRSIQRCSLLEIQVTLSSILRFKSKTRFGEYNLIYEGKYVKNSERYNYVRGLGIPVQCSMPPEIDQEIRTTCKFGHLCA